MAGISGLTALQALDAAGVSAGQRVLVVGASGGVGTFAVQLARARGARVVGVCSAAKAPLVAALGAEEVVDYAREDVTARSDRFDAILDVGGRTPVARLRRVLADRGCLVFVGGEGGDAWTGGMSRQLLAAAGGLFSSQRTVVLLTTEARADLERLGAALAAGDARAQLDRVVGLEGVATAMADLAAGRVSGKVAVRPAGA